MCENSATRSPQAPTARELHHVSVVLLKLNRNWMYSFSFWRGRKDTRTDAPPQALVVVRVLQQDCGRPVRGREVDRLQFASVAQKKGYRDK